MGKATNQIARRYDCNYSTYTVFSSDFNKCVSYYDINADSNVKQYLRAGSQSSYSIVPSKSVTDSFSGNGSFSGLYVSLNTSNLPTAMYSPSSISGTGSVTVQNITGVGSFGSYVSVSLCIYIGTTMVWSKSQSWNPGFSYTGQTITYNFTLSEAGGGTIYDYWDVYTPSGIVSARWQVTIGSGIGVTCSATFNSFTLYGLDASNKLVKYSDLTQLKKPMYTFTISPTPSSASVSLSTNGYYQSGNSITVPAGQLVSWSVSKSGYTTQSGSYVVNSNYTKYVTLSASSSGGGGTSSSSSSSRIGVWEP